MSALSYRVPEREVIEWRRHVHAHPELSYAEHATADYVHHVLTSLGVETTRPTETSVLGVINGRVSPTRRTVALRADTDALPVQEETGESFASTVPGVMHACGHDTHTAMLLGTAKVLAEHRDAFAGTVKLLFQHAEEKNPGGARDMVAAGVLQGVDRIYGVHVMNGPAGTVQVARGNATSSAGGFFLTIQGRGSHGSMPQEGVDPVLCAAQVVVALNHVVARNVAPEEFAVVNPGFIQAGAAPNVIPDTARIGVSIRTVDEATADVVYRRCDEVIRGICRAYGCSYSMERVPPYAIVVNNDACVDQVLASATTALGADRVSVSGPISGSEDFSAFTAVVPGAFVMLSGGDESVGLPFQNHHPKFNILEKPTLAAGVRLEVQLVLDELPLPGGADGR